MSFNELSLLLVVATCFGIIARFLRQPLLIGFLFAGVFLARFNLIENHEMFELLGKIGVALLLFLVGIEMNIRDLASVGKTALLTGLGQIIFTSIIGFGLAFIFGFSPIASIYIALALAFSSTIIIVKLLSEKKDLGSLYGKISIGFLLVQDFVAVMILMVLAGFKSDGASAWTTIWLLAKAGILFYSVWYLSKDVLPKIFSKVIGRSQELLFVFSIAWALGIAALVGGPLGFSFEIGGFLAGLALSNLPEHFGIVSKTKPLRDFFLVIFFIYLGSQLLIPDVQSIILPALGFSLFVLVGNPLIVMVIMGLLGYKNRTSFLASVTVAQVSEFSFILMAMGKTLGHVSNADTALVVLVGAVTMTGSTYMILGSEKIYRKIKLFLKFFERKNTIESVFENSANLGDHTILIGCDKIGSLILPYFVKRNVPVVVVDYNPSVFKTLSANNVNVILGDIVDTDIQEQVKIDKSKLVICTVPNIEENLSIAHEIKSVSGHRPAFIASADNRLDAIKLYESGADYVLNSDVIAGEFLKHLFVTHGLNVSRISKMGESNFSRLMYSNK